MNQIPHTVQPPQAPADQSAPETHVPMYGLGLRHSFPEELPYYVELLRDPRYVSNISPRGAYLSPGRLGEDSRRLLEDPPEDQMLFTIHLHGSEVIGFFWVTEIDWIAQAGKVGLALLPRRRSQFGALALRAACNYLRWEFNLQVVLTRVREGNEMLMSSDWVAERRHVLAPDYFYAHGRYLYASLWTELPEQAVRRERTADRLRQERSERLRRVVREQVAAGAGRGAGRGAAALKAGFGGGLGAGLGAGKPADGGGS